ncbi:MAG: hypothetical protein ACFFFG_04870 [Candidatus Thorarchaeota archaeon]
MSDDLYEPVSTGVSSLFYCRKLTDSKQAILLKLTTRKNSNTLLEGGGNLEDTFTHENTSVSIRTGKQDIVVKSNKYRKDVEKVTHPTFKLIPLSSINGFNMPEMDVDTLPKSRKAINHTKSPTRTRLTLALRETKKKIKKKKSSLTEGKGVRKKSQRRSETKKSSTVVRKHIRPLGRFFDKKIYPPEASLSLEPKTSSFQSLNREKRPLLDKEVHFHYLTEDQFLDDTEPFPFSTLNEWLIWHHNYPQYAHVREAYDLNEIPETMDLEIFWVNIKSEPEFFSSTWEMLGAKIADVNSIKFNGLPEFLPEWKIGSMVTDGFASLFMDVYQLLMINPKGIANNRYPIFQFAMKGLTLLGSTYMDKKTGRWHCILKDNELEMRIKVLDQFVNQQETPIGYERTLDPLLAVNKWYGGIIAFDLLASRSTFMREFTNGKTDLKEDIKIEMIKNSIFKEGVIQKLESVKELDRYTVLQIIAKLNK